MKNKVFIFVIFLSILSIFSCSKTKYKGFKQYTTNFTAYYNTYFNIKQRYKIGYREATYGKQENTNDIISVFEFENDPQFFEGVAQFKETAPKVSKLLAIRPNSKWMDDALLVEGKIRYLKGDLDSAIQVLTYLVDYYPKGYVAGHLPAGKLKGYDDLLRNAVRKKEPIKQPKLKYKFARNEGQIWLIKALIKKGQYERAQSLIYQAEADMGFPQEYRKDLLKTQAILSITNKDYPKATEKLLAVLEDKKISKKERSRINFVLAQIYEKENSLGAAKNFYEMALKGKLKDDLEFEARLKSLTLSETNSEESLSILKKMLNKGKYSHSMDKIYLAMGNIHSSKNDMVKAIENYKLAISFAKNPNQKFVIFEKIGSLFYAKSNYVMAAKYYDSAQQVIPANYPNKKEFAKKVEALNKLLVHYNKFIENDSILDLAALGPEAAKDKIEKSLKKEYESEKAKEEFQASQILASESVSSNSLAGSPSQWYFSTKESIEKGRVSFQKKWGKLTLQDNWKRSSASLSDNSSSPAKAISGKSGELESQSLDLVAEVEASKLPFSESAKKPVIAEAQHALINMARIYHYEILDISKAIETYELLLKKYPKDIPNEDEVLYSLYRLYVEKEDIANAETIKNQLFAKFPNSKYSIYANNPNAKSDDEKSDLAVAKLYKDAYKEYRLANYNQALDKCLNIENSYPKHSLIPKVKLLKAFIYSYTNQSTPFIATLKDIIANHPNTDESKTAQDYLDIINKMKKDDKAETPIPAENELSNLNSPIANKDIAFKEDKAPVEIPKPIEEKKPEPAKATKTSVPTPPSNSTETKPSQNTEVKEDGLSIVNYTYNSKSPHFVLYRLQGKMSPNTAKTLLDVFLKTRWGAMRYKCEILEIENEKFVTIGKISNLEEVYSFDEKNKDEIMLQTLTQSSEKYFISSENLDILYISSGWKQYLSFYQKNYR